MNLSSRVTKLEQLFKQGVRQRAGNLGIPESSYAPAGKEPTEPLVVPGPPLADIEATEGVESAQDVDIVAWLKEDWLMKLGAFLLLLGFGWFVNYAFNQGWIGDMGKIALGLIAGALFLVLGFWRIKDYQNQGGVFLVLWSTIILLTTYAARYYYGFFTPLTALGLMFLSTAFVALASVKYKSKPLAFASLILAGVAPLLTHSPTADSIGLFSYLLVVARGAIWIVALTGRRELTAGALVLIFIYSLPHLFKSTDADLGALLIFIYAFVAIFFITNTLGILKLQGSAINTDIVTAAANGFFLLAWIIVAAPEDWKSLIMSAWMIVFAAGAFLVFKITQRREPFYAYAAVGIAKLAAASAV